MCVSSVLLGCRGDNVELSFGEGSRRDILSFECYSILNRYRSTSLVISGNLKKRGEEDFRPCPSRV